MVSFGLSEEKLRRERELAAERARWEYYKPLIILGVTAIAGLLVGVISGQFAMLAWFTVQWLVLSVTMMAVYFASSVTWLGADAAFGICATRILAICAVMSLLMALLPFGSLGIIVLAMWSGVVMGTGVLLAIVLFEMERGDAIIVVIATFALRYILPPLALLTWSLVF